MNLLNINPNRNLAQELAIQAERERLEREAEKTGDRTKLEKFEKAIAGKRIQVQK